ncbi:ABC transporter substrate-binding protein [Companilactobacillus zhachilii]|uniref:ABC transporter substrate-binding protein n=1 Tax=Companilactobacillus zhachilii TaxID=2304606 RepID=UPI004034A52B
MKKAKQLLIFLLLLCVTIVLSACSDKNSKSSDTKATTIEFMTSSVEKDRLAVINKLVNKFEKENPSIKVKVIPVEEDSYNTKVVTLARSGKLPDIIETSQDFAKVMAKDELIDNKAINSVINNVGKENYYSRTLDLMKTENGKSYMATPITCWVQGIWYDKQKLSDAGFEEPKTWNDILKVAKFFYNPSQKKYGIAMPTANSTASEQAFSQFALSNGANVLNSKGDVTLDTHQMQQALGYYKKLSKYTMPGSNDTTEVNDAYMNGSAPMAVYSTYLLPGVYQNGNPKNVGFTIPQKKSAAAYGVVSGLTISSGLPKENVAADKKFLEFLAKPDNMATWVLMSPAGAQPVSSKVLNVKKYQKNKVVKSFGGLSTEIASSFNKVQVFGMVGDKNFVKSGDLTSSGTIGEAVNSVTVGKKNVNTALKTAQTKASSE